MTKDISHPKLLKGNIKEEGTDRTEHTGKMWFVLPLVLFLGLASGFPDTTCSPALSSVALVQQRGYSLTGKVAVITGGDSGIGYGASMGIAMAGAKLIMLGHNENKARAAALNITRDTGNTDITVIHIDLLSFKSIREAVDQILEVSSVIDVLVCDAGQNFERPGHQLSVDGFEATFQSTFLGHFLLTESLLPVLRKSRGRVVNAGCDSNGFFNTSYAILVPERDTVCHRSDAPPNCTEPEEVDRMIRQPLPTANSTYAFLAHFMKTFYARELTTRGMPAYVAHPGLVATPGLPATNVNTDQFCPYPQAWYACNCWSNSSRSYDKAVCPLTPLRGSNTLAFLATAPSTLLEASAGRFFAACELKCLPRDSKLLEVAAASCIAGRAVSTLDRLLLKLIGVLTIRIHPTHRSQIISHEQEQIKWLDNFI
ncbi:hypothetical protein CYMTET_4664 [Cymbomonas tetramitiformis]|uniref:Uncharacterized protein n=1 Tax=Cymbomonas tetramitiformis TaxID=36881 RepID=A0AAE0H0Q7_9CHLO|nr:hypothetical protein CYMTET_4664 [Cymbomonas tetramitiformis]